MEQFFEENSAWVENYPDVKVIKELPPLKVACFTYFGDEPETYAFEGLKKWAKDQGISFADQSYRIFGYNNPDPANPDSDEIYGYEYCVTIPDELYETLEDVPEGFSKGTYDSVKRRILSGGKFAVTTVKREGKENIGEGIMLAWRRFSEWLHESKYIWGGNQYLEEHLGFSGDDTHIGGVDLYISIQDAPKETMTDKTEEEIPAYRVAVFRAEGMDPEQNANESWERALAFAKGHKLDSKECRIFQYNAGFSRKPPFFHVVMITLPDSFTEDLPEVSSFSGGTYMTIHVSYDRILEGWMLMEKWRKDTKTKAANHQWVEEWTLDNWEWPCRDIKICYPIRKEQ